MGSTWYVRALRWCEIFEASSNPYTRDETDVNWGVKSLGEKKDVLPLEPEGWKFTIQLCVVIFYAFQLCLVLCFSIPFSRATHP